MRAPPGVVAVPNRRTLPGKGRYPAPLPPWPLDPPRPDPATVDQARPPRPGPPPADTAAHYCRRCRTTGDGPTPPAGWLRAQRRGDGQQDNWRPWQTLGIYCSAECLTADLTPEQTR